MQSKDDRTPSLKSVVLMGLLALGLTVFAGGVWTALLVGNLSLSPGIPWSVVVMGLLLWLVWEYLGGRWRPKSTQAVRRRYLRSNPVSFGTFIWTFVAGMLAVSALAGLWIVMVQLTNMKGNLLPEFSRYPIVTVLLVVVMASVVSSLAEEVGFRGYFQSSLEGRFRVPIAILIPCLVIAVPHALTQGFNWPVLVFYLLVDVMLGISAYLTNSILPGIAIHSVGLLVFFALVWPFDPTRIGISSGRADGWFWLHMAQAVTFALLGLLAFAYVARRTKHQGLGNSHID